MRAHYPCRARPGFTGPWQDECRPLPSCSSWIQTLHHRGGMAGWMGVAGGYAETELRVFPEHPGDRHQFSHFDASLALEPEWFRRWEDANVTLTARPFARLDGQDNDRTHVDLRELMFHKSSDQWELKAGVGKVFWGVTESQHLVDVINQTDFVENIDEEEKLGQLHDQPGLDP